MSDSTAAVLRNLGVVICLAGHATADPITITALGDSLTQGYGLPRGDGFVPQMQAWLKSHGHDIRLINAGVSGDTTAGGKARAEWTMTDDVDGVIVALGGNDVLRGLKPENAMANLSSILEVARQKHLPVLLVGITAPSNFGMIYTKKFETMYPVLSEQYGSLLYPNFMKALSQQPNRQKMLKTYMQSDKLHPNKKGVSLIVKDMGPSIVALIEQVKSAGTKEVVAQ